MNPLESSGKPLFFKLDDASKAAFAPQLNRKGAAVRTWVRSLSAMQKEAIVTSAGTGTAWRLASDEGPYLMGDDVAPCPLAFFTTGMVSSFMDQILSSARERSIRVRDIRLTQDNFYTMTGSFHRGTIKGGALPVALMVEVDCDAESSALTQAVNEALGASPVTGLLHAEMNSRFTLTHNGREIATGQVESIGRAPEPAALDQFDGTEPAAGNWSALVARAGTTPQTDENTSSVGSSLADEQNRQLHLRGICTLRADGVKKIEQHLYNPRGSIFHFLSDKASDCAPDAAAYMSAGLGFCFMTQFGRYAKIMKMNLREYSIVQDTHFFAGGADPVETHVYLATDADDSAARTALDVSERTCFLHALCRTKLDTKAEISRIRTASIP